MENAFQRYIALHCFLWDNEKKALIIFFLWSEQKALRCVRDMNSQWLMTKKDPQI